MENQNEEKKKTAVAGAGRPKTVGNTRSITLRIPGDVFPKKARLTLWGQSGRVSDYVDERC